MVHNKTPMYEFNTAASEFVPVNESLNAGLQAKTLDNFAYDNAKIVEMRDNPIYDNSLSDLDKIAAVQAEQLKNVPEVKRIAQNMTKMKQIATGQGRK